MFDRWSETYKKIIEKNPKIDVKIFDLLTKLNRQIFSLENDELNPDAFLQLYNNTLSTLKQLLEKKPIKDDQEIFLLVKEVHLDVIGSLRKAISKSIDENDEVSARKLLSQLPQESRVNVTQNLLFGYCGRYSSESASLLAIRLLRELSTNFNCNDYKGDTPLIVAADKNPHVAVLDALIEAGANVNQGARGRGVTALRLAACDGKVDFVERLLQRNANAKLDDVAQVLDLIIDSSSTPEGDELQHYLQVIELLVKAGAPVDTLDYQRHTPLKNAVLKGRWPFADLLLTLGANLYPDIVNDAIESNKEELLRNLIQKYPVTIPEQIPYSRSRSFFYNSDHTTISLDIFQLCLTSGMSLELYSLTDGVVLQTPEAVRDCLKRNKKLDMKISSISTSIISRRICSGDSPGDRMGCLFPHFAAAFAVRESLAILIAAGLDIHIKDHLGLTPLHYAAAYGNEEAVKLLILAGADVNATDKNGQTPLHWAVQHGMALSVQNIPCARVLLYAGADPTCTDVKSRIPLKCLYTGGFTHEEQGKWKALFREQKPRDATKPKREYNECPTLAHLAASVIVSTSRLTQGLFYRTRLPEKLSCVVEEIASQHLTPPQ